MGVLLLFQQEGHIGNFAFFNEHKNKTIRKMATGLIFILARTTCGKNIFDKPTLKFLFVVPTGWLTSTPITLSSL